MSNQIIPGANGDIFRNAPRANCPRTKFDLSMVHTTSQDFGELKPFALYDVLPGDTFTLDTVIKLESMPMVTPLWQAMKLRTWWFYVPYSCLWSHFDRFIQGGRDGNYTASLPTIGSSSAVMGSYGSLIDDFGFPIGKDLKNAGISALPFMAYQRIYRDFFLNQDVETSTNINEWFPDTDDLFTLADGAQISITPDASSPSISLLTKRYVNFEKDYFTSAMFSPQRGDPVAMPVDVSVDSDVPLIFNNANGSLLVSTANHHFAFGGAYTSGNGYTYDCVVGPSGVSQNNVIDTANNSQTLWTSLSDAEKLKRIPFKISKTDLTNAFGTTSAGFLIDDLRLATQLQIWLERNMRIQAKIKQFYPAHFGVDIDDNRCREPYFIGGSTSILTVSEIIQTSESSATSDLGNSAGITRLMDGSSIGTHFCKEFGLIMGLSAIVPDVMYINQGLPREWTKTNRFDFYFPEFANLSPQAILNKELYYDPGLTDNDNVFGYVDMWSEYRQKRNIVSGIFGDSSIQDFYNYTMARAFTSRPTLSKTFITTENNVRKSMFTGNTTMPPFKVQYGIKCRAVRPIPYHSTPSGLL